MFPISKRWAFAPLSIFVVHNSLYLYYTMWYLPDSYACIVEVIMYGFSRYKHSDFEG